MIKSLMLFLFVCLIFSAKSQSPPNNTSQLYAQGYSLGKKTYDLVHTSGGTTATVRQQILNNEDRKNNYYDQIMETWHTPALGNAYNDGYLNGFINSGRSTVNSNSFTYTAPPNGSSLDHLLNYDASILYPAGSNTRTYMETGQVIVVTSSTGGGMSLQYTINNDDNSISIIITFK